MQQKFKKIEIKVCGPREGQELSMSLPWDANIEDWRDAFKVILTQQTFSPDTINELFYDEDRLLFDLEELNNTEKSEY